MAVTPIDPMSGTVDNPIPRPAARVLLIDGAERVLLFRGFDPANHEYRYWFTAGGGLDEGESSADGAVRELREETGLVVPVERLGPSIWHETALFPYDGRWYRQEQDYYVVRVDSWEVTVDGFGEEERRSIDDHRWWSMAELLTTEEQYYPPRLPDLMREILGS